jgi:hypothetical protein
MAKVKCPDCGSDVELDSWCHTCKAYKSKRAGVYSSAYVYEDTSQGTPIVNMFTMETAADLDPWWDEHHDGNPAYFGDN